ncbi:MAG TPA: sugar transferase [Anaerolineae bacterium]|nr:sugar transferase [Anaerolineae bacterium]
MNIEQATLSTLAHRHLAQQVTQKRPKDVSGWYLLFLPVVDAGLTVAALWLAVELRRALPFGPTLIDEGWVSPQVYLVAIVLGLVVYGAMGVYQAERLRSFGVEIWAVLKATLVGIALLAGLLYFVEREVSRWLYVYFGLLQVGLVAAARLAIHSLCGILNLSLTRPRRTLIIGASAIGQEVAQRLSQTKRGDYQVIGYLDDGNAQATAPPDLPIWGPLDHAESIARDLMVDELLVALPLSESHALARLMDTIHDLPVQVKVIPDYFDLAYLYSRADELAGMPVISLKEPVLAPRQRAMKRAFDLIVASLLLVLVGPLLLIGALAIKLDSAGSALYRQKRIGEGGRPFAMYKLRTMVVDADGDEHRLIEMNGDSVQFSKGPHDPRVTRVGAFLRRWSIDELPQLLNVIKGDLSLVGPRPELPALVERYSSWQHKRFSAPQGVTGWWQVNGRPQSVDQKVEHDLYYVRHYSMWLDMWILVKTIPAVISQDGAF